MKPRSVRRLHLESLEDRRQMATLTGLPTVVGPTPAALGYNLGHFMAGSNAADWWRYTGAAAARAFVSASDIEPTDDLPGTGDGVTDQASFLSRRAAVRANVSDPAQPLNNGLVNWPKFQERYQNAVGDTNRFTIHHAFTELRRQNVDILANITASPNRFPLAGATDWPNQWELWQHYYAQAFHLGSNFDVARYSMFNEPNNWTGLTVDDWLLRLHVASDAIKSAISDVNGRFGKSLRAQVFAPNTANGATKYLEWGQPAVLRRHDRIDGTTDPNWTTFDVYNYQKYSMNQQATATASGYIDDLRDLQNLLAADTPGNTPPIALTEYNVRTGDSYDGRTETLDSPSDYAALGANSVALAENNASQLYLFKFAQTARQGTTNYPVAKNGTHYVQNGATGNQYGGATKAAEVFRLFNKAAAAGRNRMAYQSDAGSQVWTLMSHDGPSDTYYAFIVNNSSSDVPLAINVQGWGVAEGTQVVVEEVSERASGGVIRKTQVVAGSVPSANLPALSAWLVSIPKRALAESIVPAAADAVLADGLQKTATAGNGSSLTVRSDGTVDGRRVALLKFPLAGLDLSQSQRTLLSLQVSTSSQATATQAHVYGLDNDPWNEVDATWASLPAILKQNVTAGNQIANNVVANQGISARILGQIVANATSPSERQIDVSAFIRSQTDGWASFLIVQDHRWDVALPSLATGDTQADGLVIVSREAGSAATPGPQLRILGSQPAVAPSITTQPASRSAIEGQSVTFSVAAAGSGTLSYQWRRDGVAITGATGTSFTIARVSLADHQAQYSVVVSNSVGSITSEDAVLSVEPQAAKFFVVDQTADRTFRYQADGSYVASHALESTNTISRGIAADATASTFWTIDSNRRVYVYNASMQVVGSWTASGLSSPTGISKTGSDIWIVDSGLRKVFVYGNAASTTTGTRTFTRSFSLNKSNTNPQDLVTDGSRVWVTQAGTTDKVFVYQASNGSLLGSWSIDSANSSPYGITLDPTTTSGSLWIVDNVTDRVYEYTNARSRVSGSQTAAKTFVLDAANSSPQGIADPPSATKVKRPATAKAPATKSPWRLPDGWRFALASRRK